MGVVQSPDKRPVFYSISLWVGLIIESPQNSSPELLNKFKMCFHPFVSVKIKVWDKNHLQIRRVYSLALIQAFIYIFILS